MSEATVAEWITKHSVELVHGEPGEPLDDVRPLAPMVRDAKVVALGAATRMSRESSVVAHRVLRLLVEEEGFRSLALEGDDPVRLGLAAYVASGDGDPRSMLAGARAFWRTEEILDVVRWMRSYNLRHPDDPVRFAETPDRTAQDAKPPDGLAGVERTLADGVAWWRDRSGDKIVYWGGMAHTAVGDPRTIIQAAPPQTHRNMGGHLRERMGQDYRSIGLTMGHGSIGVPLPRPSASFVDSVLGEAAAGRAGYVLDLRESQPEAVRRRLGAATKTRLIGPFYDPANDAAYYMSGGSLRTWFDVVIHTEEVTPARLLQPLPA